MVKSLIKKKTTFEEPNVNLTPLIDVVFVILIMFIIIAPLLEIENIKLAGSSANPKDFKEISKELGPISIQVHSDNTIRFNQTPVSLIRLKDLLIEAKKNYPEAIPRLLQDKASPFGTYQSIKNILEEVGFQEMDVILQSGG